MNPQATSEEVETCRSHWDATVRLLSGREPPAVVNSHRSILRFRRSDIIFRQRPPLTVLTVTLPRLQHTQAASESPHVGTTGEAREALTEATA